VFAVLQQFVGVVGDLVDHVLARNQNVVLVVFSEEAVHENWSGNYITETLVGGMRN